MNKFEAKDIEIGGKVYAVTKDGGVFMHSYTDRAGKIRKSKWLQQGQLKGRPSVHITHLDGKGYNVYVHKLVMMAWGHAKPDDGQDWTIDHIDEDSSNNHIDNLQWMTRSDNIKKAIANGKTGWGVYHEKKGV